MLTPLPDDDDSLEGLLGAVIPSEVTPGAGYRLVWRLGEGAMSVVFFAMRVSGDGELPVVLKVLRPSFVTSAGEAAALAMKKEAIALGRLNERVPPTPFVVRFIDTGTFAVQASKAVVALPWVVVEYVHGGAEGTTLSERVDHSLRATGAAFDPARAAHAIECLGAGLSAVHEVGVIHRDLKPDNVLCCGFGADEIFKIADFGVARPAGVATFSGAIVGTPGFVAPELTTGDARAIGPWSDIFSLAAVFFYMLTGEEYFPARTPAEAILATIAPTRRSIRDTSGLAPELRAHEEACRAIDAALAAATGAKTESRPRRADALAAMLVPWLRAETPRPSLAKKRLAHLSVPDDFAEVMRWSWTRVKNPSQSIVIRSVAWDGDGRAMAATSQGLAFWNGTSWSDVRAAEAQAPASIRFVKRVAAGEWLAFGEDATVAKYTPFGAVDLRKLEGPLESIELVSGDLDDLAVLVGRAMGSPPMLCARSGKRWLKPLVLADVVALSSLARVEDARWLIAGRGADGKGYVGLYSPLDWEVCRLSALDARAYLACSGQYDRDLGVATGAGGAVLVWQNASARVERIEGEYDLSAASIDAIGGIWAASAGRIWTRRGATGASPPRWERVWSDEAWPLPIVSLFTDVGVVIAMTADGGLIEGRALKATLFDGE